MPGVGRTDARGEIVENLDRLGPVLILLVTAGLVVLLDVIRRDENTGAISGLALVGLALSALDTAWLVGRDMRGFAFQETIVLDHFSLFFNFFFAAVAAFTVVASTDYAARLRGRFGEFVALALCIAAGAMLMAAANDLITLYVSIELTSISQYALAGFAHDDRSSEAGLKYLLLGATSSAVLLYGFALLYGLTGTTQIDEIGRIAANAVSGERAAYLTAAVALAAGFGFKMAIVPFQMWAPDIYQGSPTPVAAYLSVASKAAGFAVALRVFNTALGQGYVTRDWVNLFAVLAAISMTVGNVMATRQTSVKRLLGYSTIAQSGTMLVGVAATLAHGREFTLAAFSVLFYLSAYAFTNLGAFFTVSAVTARTGRDDLASLAGLWRRAPVLALGLALCLMSLTGLPPTAGFFGKFFIFQAAIDAKLTWLVVIGVLNTAISAFYYLRVVRAIFVDEETAGATSAEMANLPVRFAVGLAALGVLAFGIVPAPLINAAQRAADVFARG